MSLSILRDAVAKKFQERVDKAAERAINMRVHAESHTDGYALVQADTLAEARAFGEAIKLLTDEYKRLTEAPQTQQDVAETPKVREKIYG